MPADSSCLSVFTRLSKDQQKIEATFSEVPFLYKPFAKQVVALRTGRALEHQINIEKRAWHILANRAFVTGCPQNDVALQGRIPRLPSRSVGKRGIGSRVSRRFARFNHQRSVLQGPAATSVRERQLLPRQGEAG
ncbi:hypothetical protein BO91_02195, partial [Candidatus Synechococcus spongiarum LMB bulk10E]